MTDDNHDGSTEKNKEAQQVSLGLLGQETRLRFTVKPKNNGWSIIIMITQSFLQSVSLTLNPRTKTFLKQKLEDPVQENLNSFTSFYG